MGWSNLYQILHTCRDVSYVIILRILVLIFQGTYRFCTVRVEVQGFPSIRWLGLTTTSTNVLPWYNALSFTYVVFRPI